MFSVISRNQLKLKKKNHYSRLFGNRAFCYEKMQQYEKALIDADIALSLNPTWIKGLYRKGKALVGLKVNYTLYSGTLHRNTHTKNIIVYPPPFSCYHQCLLFVEIL